MPPRPVPLRAPGPWVSLRRATPGTSAGWASPTTTSQACRTASSTAWWCGAPSTEWRGGEEAGQRPAGVPAGEHCVLYARILDDVAEHRAHAGRAVENLVVQRRDRVAAAQDPAERIVQLSQRIRRPDPAEDVQSPL